MYKDFCEVANRSSVKSLSLGSELENALVKMLLSRVNEIPGKSLDFATAVSSCNSSVFHLLHHKTTTPNYPRET